MRAALGSCARAIAFVMALAVSGAMAAGHASGQEPDTTSAPPTGTAPDTGSTQPGTPDPVSSSTTRARAARSAVGRDAHRFEIGAAVAEGPFDALGTLAFHRYVRRGGPFENWIHVELSGTAAPYLNEGAVSAAYLIRPLFLIRREGIIRPILEAGPAGHLVVQVAEVRDFDETVFHARAYLKTHAFAGFDLRLGGGWGLVARGRFTVPAHRPFDYAQIAFFFR